MYFGRNDATYELKGVQVSTNDITTNVNRGTADVSSEFNTDILKEIRLPEADPPCFFCGGHLPQTFARSKQYLPVIFVRLEFIRQNFHDSWCRKLLAI